MCQWGGVEKTLAGGGGDEREFGEGLSGLWKATIDGHIFQILGAGIDGFGLRSAGSGGEPTEGPEDMVPSGKNNRKGGSQS